MGFCWKINFVKKILMGCLIIAVWLLMTFMIKASSIFLKLKVGDFLLITVKI